MRQVIVWTPTLLLSCYFRILNTIINPSNCESLDTNFIIMPIIPVTCPRCGNLVTVDCSYSGGGSSAVGICRSCGQNVHVLYQNDSFGFRIKEVR